MTDQRSSPAPTEPQSPVPDGFVNRRMLREMANATEHDLKSLEGDRLLKAAKRGAGGWRLYTLSQVERVREQVRERRQLRQDRSGAPPSKHLPAFRDQAVPYSLEEYNAVLDAVSKGISRERVPIVTSVHPAIVKSIFKDQSELTDGIFVDKSTVDAINSLPLPGVGTVRSATELLEAMKQINEEIVDGRSCLGFGAKRKGQKCTSPRTHCLACARAYAHREMLLKEREKARESASKTLGPDGLAVNVTSATKTE